jgi:hypothetical protein
MVEPFKLFTMNEHYYSSSIIEDLDYLLDRLRQDRRVALKYKKMDSGQFYDWAKNGVTRKQYNKLVSLNIIV